jgi:hypothetical protein
VITGVDDALGLGARGKLIGGQRDRRQRVAALTTMPVLRIHFWRPSILIAGIPACVRVIAG